MRGIAEYMKQNPVTSRLRGIAEYKKQNPVFCNTSHGPLSVYQVSLQYFYRCGPNKSDGQTDEQTNRWSNGRTKRQLYVFPSGSIKTFTHSFLLTVEQCQRNNIANL